LNTALPSTGTLDVQISGLELWLRSAWRRQILLLGCVVVLTALSSRIWIQSSSGFGPELDWFEIVGRRFIDWGVWALLFEPIAWLARMSVRLSRYWFVLIAVHAPLSVGVAHVAVELDDAITDSVFEPIQWPQNWRQNDDQENTARDGDEVASANESLAPQETPQQDEGRRSAGTGSRAGDVAPGP